MGGSAYWFASYYDDTLPDLGSLERIRPRLTTTIMSGDGVVLKRLFTQRRELVPHEQLPPALTDALISTEDRKFWTHWGVDVRGIARAVLNKIRRGGRTQGTSTITQQLARNLFITTVGSERSITRKIKEALTAVKIERTFTKPEIIQLYLNQVYFGSGAYGVQAAAKEYFDRPASDLLVEQCATFVGMLRAPNNYRPDRHPERARRRRNVVLRTMGVTGALTQSEVDSLSAIPMITNKPQEPPGIAPYFTEFVRTSLSKRIARNDSVRSDFARALGMPDSVGTDEIIFGGGLHIQTTLDTRLQVLAERAVTEQLALMQATFDEGVRTGEHPEWLDPALFDTSASDTAALRAKPIQAALICLDPATGAILAMVGGRDFRESKFNRAVQALRQPGSAFKPFVYMAAIDNGYAPNYLLLDQPFTIEDIDTFGNRRLWRPQNYDKTVGGLTPLRVGLMRSRNLIAIRLLEKIRPRLAIQYARQLGITTKLPGVPSLALGVGEVILMQLAAAYGGVANRGIYTSPIGVTRVSNREGMTIGPQTSAGAQRQVLSAESAFIITSMMTSAFDCLPEREPEPQYRRPWGTAIGARSRLYYKRPSAGKTGTTNDYGDAWFVGYTPQLVTGVWVGFDEKADMGKKHSGSGAALPIWATFMKAAHDTLGLPVAEFESPGAGVIERRVCTTTWKSATDYCPDTYREHFRQSDVEEACNVHRVGAVVRSRPNIPGDRARPNRTDNRF